MPRQRLKHKDREIKSVTQLLEYLKKDAKENQFYWFRGQQDVSWKLVPYLGRKRNTVKAEASLIARFKQNAMLLINPRPTKGWEWLTIMQHHGVPTRLLDWTESPLVGLYFAVHGKPKKDGALWVLTPCVLNKISNITHAYPKYIPHFGEKIIEDYSPESVSSETTTSKKPIAIMGPRNTPRMQAQLGVFTIIHREAIAIEELDNPTHIWRYVIPKRSKKAIIEELSRIKIGKFQLFPEIQSIGDILREEIK